MNQETNTEATQATETNTTQVETTDTQTESKPLTIEDVQKMIQSETDKVRTEYSKKLKDKDKELESIKVEKMTEEEKKAHEIEMTLQENAKLKADLLKASTVSKLASVTLPFEFAEFINGSNEEEVTVQVNNLKLLFDKAVTEKAKEVFNGKGTEHKQTTATASTMTKAEFTSLNYFQQLELANTNPVLYAEFTK